VGTVLLKPVKPGDSVNTNVTWEDLYRAALLELRPEKLRQRIDSAERAIQQRIADLRQNDCDSREERHALDDALRGLRVLARTECKPKPSTHSDQVEGEVTS
jgi:hypothetical protein